MNRFKNRIKPYERPMYLHIDALVPGSKMPENDQNVYMMFTNVSYSTNSTRQLYLNLERNSDYTQMSTPTDSFDKTRNNFVINL